MSGKRFQAKAKTVQKLGRDGLVERNVATGEETRVSQRTADISFGPERTVEQVAGHRAVQRDSGDPAAPAKKRRKQPRPIQQTAAEAAYAAQVPASAPEVPAPDIPSMRMAVDAPMLVPAATGEDTPPPPPVSRKRQKNRKKSKQRQAAKHTPDAARSLDDRSIRGAGDAPTQKRPPRPVEGGGRLIFGTAEGKRPLSDSKQAAMKKQQARRFVPDAAQPAASGEQRSSRLMDDGGGRLHFEGTTDRAVAVPDAEPSSEARQAVKKRQVMGHAATTPHPMATVEQRPSRLMEDGGGRSTFETAEVEHPVSDRRQTDDAKANVNKRLARRFTPDAAQSAASGEQHPSRLMKDGGGRLHFEGATPDDKQASDAKTGIKKRQTRRLVPDTAQPAASGEQRSSRLMEDGGGRLHFEGTVGHTVAVPDTEHSSESKRADKKRQVMDHAAVAVRSETVPPPFADSEADTRQRDSPQAEPKAPELAAVPDDRAAYKKWQAARLAAHSAAPISVERRRLQFEDKTPPQADSPPAPAPKEDAPPPNQKYDRAVRRVERAEKQVEQARADLPVKRRLSIRPELDSETGRPRRRLHFENEVLPEYRKPSLPARAGDMAKTAAVLKLHGKIHESERDNVAVEASHKSELFAEQGVGRALRWHRNRRRSTPYRALRHAEKRAAKENINLAWQTALRDNPELQRKHALAKWMQKQKLKRKYAQAAHEAKQTARHTQNVLNATGQIVRAIQQYVAAHKSLLAVVALLALVVVFFSAGITSCTAMLSGFQSSYISASYMANEQDICNSDLYYTELETDLQIDIDQTEENYPGYDEYRYNIGEISHNPYELTGYLSTKFNAFTFDQVQAEIARLFGEQYQLTREVIVETRYDSDDEPYDWYVLQTTLTVRPLSDVILESLTPGEQTDRYGVYMQTLGNRQAYGNPFDFPWLGYASSDYGYRVHPITGEKNLHRGVDIAVAQGTPIKAIQDGRVVSAGESGSYGLCVVIEDDKGYQSRYAHCSSLSVSAGQEVKRGDVIAAVGSTGQSTGPHLHLEVMLNGEYLNPYYFVDTGGAGGGAIPGTPGGPVIPDYPGEPPSDETFAAMLAEAEKYLGYGPMSCTS